MFKKLRTVLLYGILPLCLIGMASIASSCSGGSDSTELNIEYLPIQLEKDGYWSFVSKDGKIKYENEFKSAPTQVINGIFSVREGDGFSVYKANGNKPKLIPGLEGLAFVGICNDNLFPVCFENKRFSIVNKEGKEQFELGPINGKEIISCGPCFEEGMLWIRTEDNKEGFVNTSGKCIIQPIYEEVGTFYKGKALALKDDVWSVINNKGEKIVSFKQGMKPIAGWAMGKNSPRSSNCKINQIFLENSEGRFYMYDGKEELTKLSAKIKKIEGYSDNKIIYRSESFEIGMMSVDGEIIIRQKYTRLSFGEKGELIGYYKDNEWDILDYSGNVKNKLNLSDVVSIKNFGYIGGEESSYTIINKDGKPIDKKLDFVWFSQTESLGLNRSRYIPSAKIVKTVMDMITSDGVGQFKFGESMKNIALSKGLTLNDCQNEALLGIIYNEYENFNIRVKAMSRQYIAYNQFDWSAYDYSLTWNPECKIECFIIYVDTYNFNLCPWKNGIKDFEEALKQKGYEEIRREMTAGLPAVLLSNYDKSIIIGMNTTDVILFYVKNLPKEFEESVFDVFRSSHTEDS